MHGFPTTANPLMAGGAPVPGVAHVPGPSYPPGVAPNLTQYPAAPMTGFPAQALPPQPMPYLGSPGIAPTGTYPGAAPGGQAPLFQQVPGPATLGPAPMAGAPGGVPGVSMAPVSGIQPPATPGGPHPLPFMPQVPLPQGFPNPFATQQVPAAAPQHPPGGITTVTGPQGYMPGIGHFGTPGAPGQPGLPGPATGIPMPPTGMSGPTAGMPTPAPYYTGLPQGQPPMGIPGAPMAPPQAAQPQAGVQAGQQQSPFWLHLAWQLANTPAVKAAVGEPIQRLLADDKRQQTLQVAAQCLMGPEMQTAFRSLTSGSMDQTRFTESYASALKTALQTARLLD